MKVVALTDVGYQREINQDTFFASNERKIFAVADGMGGHKAGEIASRIVYDYLMENDSLEEKNFKQIFDEINNRIILTAESDDEYKGMGTTLTLVRVIGDRISVGHIGDSRAYLIRDGKIMQMTTDHTMVNELLKVEEITPEQAIAHPYRHVLSRALGVENNISIEEKTYKLEKEDQILLSTDGLHGLLSDEEIIMVFNESAGDLEEIGNSLLHNALDKGGNDNITIILLRDIFEDGEK